MAARREGQHDKAYCNLPAGNIPYPAFLSKHWFQEENAYALRWHVRHIILKQFREQTKLPKDHPSVINMIADIKNFAESKVRK